MSVLNPMRSAFFEPGLKIATFDNGMGIAKEHTDFVRFVNAVMQKIKHDGTWKSFYKKWFDKLGPAPEPPAGTYVE